MSEKQESQPAINMAAAPAMLAALEEVACACEGRSVVPVTDFLAAVLDAIDTARGVTAKGEARRGNQ